MKDPLGGTFPGNQIPLSRFDPASLNLLTKYVPVSSDNCGLELYGQPANNPDYQYIGRVDYVQSDKHTLFGRYYLYNYTAQAFFNGTNVLTTGPNPGNRDQTMTATIGDTYTLNATSVNSFHATFDRRADNRGVRPACSVPTSWESRDSRRHDRHVHADHDQQLFQRGLRNVRSGIFRRQQLSVLGRLFEDHREASDLGRYRLPERAVQFGQQPAVQRSVDVQRHRDGRCAGGRSARKNGQPDGWKRVSDYIRQTVFGIYVQDSWRVSSHLTVNLGVRWEPYEPPVDKQCRGNQFSLSEFEAGYHSSAYPRAPAGLLSRPRLGQR